MAKEQDFVQDFYWLYDLVVSEPYSLLLLFCHSRAVAAYDYNMLWIVTIPKSLYLALTICHHIARVPKHSVNFQQLTLFANMISHKRHSKC